MRKRQALWACVGAALVLGLAGTLAALFLLRPDAVTQASCDRVREGMTEAEVEAVFGYRADRRQTVVVTLDFPDRPARYQKNWSGREGVAVVAFSAEGTVVWKSLVQLPEEGWFDRLARLLGL
jgi:hypothetical protein